MTNKLQAHENALYVLQRKALPIPNPLPVSSPTSNQLHTDLTRTLDDLRVQHDKDLKFLYDSHASNYLSDMKHRYHSKDPTQILGVPTDPLADLADTTYQSRLQSLRDPAYRTHLPSESTNCRYRHLRLTFDVQDRLRKIEERRKRARLQEEKRFPQTIEELHTKSDMMKYEIALLLLHNQEGIRHKYNWQPTEIKALKDLAAKDSAFGAELVVIALTNPTATKDPRKKE